MRSCITVPPSKKKASHLIGYDVNRKRLYWALYSIEKHACAVAGATWNKYINSMFNMHLLSGLLDWNLKWTLVEGSFKSLQVLVLGLRASWHVQPNSVGFWACGPLGDENQMADSDLCYFVSKRLHFINCCSECCILSRPRRPFFVLCFF